MLNRALRLLLVASLVTGTLRAADDPFVGKWKVNPSKSKPTDQMILEVAGANRYTITFAPGAVDTIVADGTDQPALRGTTFSIKVVDSNHWTAIRKDKGRMLIAGYWTLSADGQTLADAYNEYEPDGSILHQHYMYARTAGTSGFPGTWVAVSEGIDAVIELQVQPWQGNGLNFNSPAAQVTRNIKFDGSDSPVVGENVPPGSVSSARRVNQRTLQITDKVQGKITDTRTIELSSDLKTLTITVHWADQKKPQDILVFDRE